MLHRRRISCFLSSSSGRLNTQHKYLFPIAKAPFIKALLKSNNLEISLHGSRATSGVASAGPTESTVKPIAASPIPGGWEGY